MNTVRTYRKYDREFKLEAVRLVTEGGKSVPEVARDLGIHKNVLYNWRNKYLEDTNHAFPGKGHLKPAEEDLRKLQSGGPGLLDRKQGNISGKTVPG
jgi:transposase